MDSLSLNFAIALVAGFLSFASPCVLPLVPVYLSYLAGAAVGANVGVQPTRLQLFIQALAFVLGFSTVFVSLGALAGLLGLTLQPYMPLFRQVGGALLIVLGLHTAGLFRISFLYREWRPGLNWGRRFGPATSFVVGMVFAFGWTPCVGPVLGGILLLASTSETALQGAYLLASYSLGMGIPFLIAGLLAGALMGLLKAANRYLRVVEVISGLMLVGLGFMVFTGQLERLTGLLPTSFLPTSF
ncbi:MAG: cytochrome c biogenesis CcdA family protein [Chloroflexota bacterium]